MTDILSNIYNNLNDLIIKKVHHDKELLCKRLILEHNKVCRFSFKIKNNYDVKNNIFEFKVSVKYILFILNYLLSKNIININDYKIIENYRYVLHFGGYVI